MFNRFRAWLASRPDKRVAPFYLDELQQRIGSLRQKRSALGRLKGTRGIRAEIDAHLRELRGAKRTLQEAIKTNNLSAIQSARERAVNAFNEAMYLEARIESDFSPL